MDLKSTLNLPPADAGIPMKADLARREPERQAAWNQMRLYHSLLEDRKNNETFLLHDGPPYTNAPIHLGTALNKILKDFALKSRLLMGYRVPYVPGYDNHGLPIEMTVQAAFNEKKIVPTVVELRAACRAHAEKYIGVQQEQFQRLGIFGLWEKPYTSMGFRYEAELIRVFKRLIEGGYIYRGLRSVLWSPTSRTALADTETEYHDHVSTAMYVAFPLLRDPDGVLAGFDNLSTIIWTTTPWTIPANVAVAYHPDFTYDVVATGGKHYVLLHDLVECTMSKIGATEYKTVKQVEGKQLENVVYKHPIFDRDSRAVLADYVTTEDGTGVVHTAPGHGREDFQTGQKYKLEVLCPVDEKGVMTKEAGEFEGLFYAKANQAVVERLRELGALLQAEEYHHKYPYAERDGQPVIFRATEQWFIGIDTPFHLDPKVTLREKMLDGIEECTFFPQSGHDRLIAMVSNRPDWCISRQRPWGVGIPVFYGKESGVPVLDPVAVDCVAKLVEEQGSDAWYSVAAEDILPKGYKHPETGETEFRKEVDVFDVWYDAGSTHLAVLEGNVEPEWKETMPADLYSEGSDQHRGWFNVSLVIGTATRGQTPFRQVVTHGMVTDEQGRKQSKRLGNVIDPVKVCNTNGADVLRVWAATVDYTTDTPCTEKILESAGDLYRTVRNTLRFLLMNLYDYDSSQPSEMDELDQWAVEATRGLANQVLDYLEKYEYPKAFSAIHHFCVNELSRFYLDTLKDKMYCDGADWPSRRGAQKACLEIAHILVRLVYTFAPHTADEVYAQLPLKDKKPSVFHESVKPFEGMDNMLGQKIQRLLTLRGDVSTLLEEWKKEAGIKDTQDVDVTLTVQSTDYSHLCSFGATLPNLLRVASVELQEGQFAASFKASELPKCERSRVRRPDVKEVDWNGEKVWLSARDRRAVGLA